MEHIHLDLQLNKDDVLEINLDHAANVLLMQSASYGQYLSGKRYEYFGGHVIRSPYQMLVPEEGRWHLIIDLGGFPGVVNATLQVKRGDHHRETQFQTPIKASLRSGVPAKEKKSKVPLLTALMKTK